MPQGWRRLGRIGFSGAFGAVLGLGFLTVPASAGLPVLYAFSLTGASWTYVAAIALLFGLTRAIPGAVTAVMETRRGAAAFVALQRLDRTLRLLYPVELALLVFIGYVYLRH